MSEIPLKFMIELILLRTRKLLDDVYQQWGEFYFDDDLKAIINALELCFQALEREQ